MNRLDALRAVVWFVPLVLAVLLIALRRPTRPLMTALLLGLAWNAWAVLAVNLIAIEYGWWAFSGASPVFMGMPAELWFGWVLLWGAVAPLMVHERPVVLALVAVLWLDLIAMPALEPLVVLKGSWLLGEFLALMVALLPGLLLFRWTFERSHLRARASLQVLCAGALLLWLVPSIAFEFGAGWQPLLDLPGWRRSLALQSLLLPVALGVRAAIEFVERGQGTPLPYDPPQHLVTSGPYAYVRNPMQLSMVLIFAITALILWNVWLATGAFLAFVYGAGLAQWHEDLELSDRHGDAWSSYRAGVRMWVPSVRPVVEREATLLIAYSCETCSSIGRWFRLRHPVGLRVAPAEDSAVRGIRRVTYLPPDGAPSTGVAAVARALEHIHLGWALAGWILALPVVVHLAQVIADVFGPTPHPVEGLPYDRTACDTPRSRVLS